jgi:hypothetical protein
MKSIEDYDNIAPMKSIEDYDKEITEKLKALNPTLFEGFKFCNYF